MKEQQSGFTLIEVMIVVAIVAILAAIAYPSYLDSVRKGYRAEAKAIMLNIQRDEEKHRANNTTYQANLATLGFTGPFVDGRYTMALSSVSATEFVITATAQALGSQNQDTASGTSCSSLTYTLSTDSYAPSACW